MMKRCICMMIVSVLLPLVMLTSCSESKPADSDVIYSSDRVKLTLCDPKPKSELGHAEFMVPTPESLIKGNPVVLKGRISNVRQAAASFDYYGEQTENHLTLFDVEDPIFVSCLIDELKTKEKLTLYVSYNNENRYEGCPLLLEGKTVLVFCEPTAGLKEDPLESSKFADCVLGFPATSLCEETNGYYVFWDIYPDSEEKLRLTEDVGLDEADIDVIGSFSEQEVIDMIDGKGVCSKDAVKASAAALKMIAERYSGEDGPFIPMMRYSIMECAAFEEMLCGML